MAIGPMPAIHTQVESQCRAPAAPSSLSRPRASASPREARDAAPPSQQDPPDRVARLTAARRARRIVAKAPTKNVTRRPSPRRPRRRAPVTTTAANEPTISSQATRRGGQLTRGHREPERDVRGLHRLGHDAAQVGAQRVEVDLVAQPGAERLERARRVVAAAVEAPVDERLDARAAPAGTAPPPRASSPRSRGRTRRRAASADCSSTHAPRYAAPRVAVSAP